MSGAIVAVAVARARQRIASHFTEAGAITKAKAVAYTPSSHRMEKRMFARMLAFGALVETSPGHFYLDERRFADFRKESLAKVLGILAIAGFAAAGAMLVTG
jgi:hypothetical protein